MLFRRDLGPRFDVPPGTRPTDRTLLIVSIVVLIALLPALVSGVAVWIPACAAALVLLVALAIRKPSVVRPNLIPWALVAFAGGLFLIVDAAQHLGLPSLLAAATGTGTSFFDLLRLAGAGAASANLANNLPAYLALEPAACGNPVRIMALLIGVNCGALITPWASLATLLWRNRLDTLDAAVPWRQFVTLGAVVAPLIVVGGGVAALAFLG